MISVSSDQSVSVRLRVVTVVGTRPEIIRLSRTLCALDRAFDHVLIHTGQNYDPLLSQVFFDQMGLRAPDYNLESAGGSALHTIGALLANIDPILDQVRPDAMLLLGDTDSCLAVIAAKKKQIPVFHMEAGNRCFDERVPEEVNRRLVDHLSDINLPYSDLARENLLREGLPPDRVIKTGSPMREVLDFYADGIESSDVLARLGLEEQNYYVISCHRAENVDHPDRLARLGAVLHAVAARDSCRVVFTAHPRTRERLTRFGTALPPQVELLPPFGFLDYVQLQKRAKVVLSDSGTITEESSILGFPALNLRDAHERPEGMEEAAVMMTGLEPDRVVQGLEILGRSKPMSSVSDYETSSVSEKVVRIILSYTDYARRRVWQS